jgi:hypothetical protein
MYLSVEKGPVLTDVVCRTTDTRLLEDLLALAEEGSGTTTTWGTG